MINRRGPKILPWGIPLTTLCQEEYIPLTTTLNRLLSKKSVIHEIILLFTPYECNLLINRLWGTLSNAFSKSIYIYTVKQKQNLQASKSCCQWKLKGSLINESLPLPSCCQYTNHLADCYRHWMPGIHVIFRVFLSGISALGSRQSTRPVKRETDGALLCWRPRI